MKLINNSEIPFPDQNMLQGELLEDCFSEKPYCTLGVGNINHHLQWKKGINLKNRFSKKDIKEKKQMDKWVGQRDKVTECDEKGQRWKTKIAKRRLSESPKEPKDLPKGDSNPFKISPVLMEQWQSPTQMGGYEERVRGHQLAFYLLPDPSMVHFSDLFKLGLFPCWLTRQYIMTRSWHGR